jgi:hypothetical protein
LTEAHKDALFAWLISHQLAVLFSHNKPATSNQAAVLFSQNKPAPDISHQPTEQAAFRPLIFLSPFAPKNSGRIFLSFFLSFSSDCK